MQKETSQSISAKPEVQANKYEDARGYLKAAVESSELPVFCPSAVRQSWRQAAIS